MTEEKNTSEEVNVGAALLAELQALKAEVAELKGEKKEEVEQDLSQPRKDREGREYTSFFRGDLDVALATTLHDLFGYSEVDMPEFKRNGYYGPYVEKIGDNSVIPTRLVVRPAWLRSVRAGS